MKITSLAHRPDAYLSCLLALMLNAGCGSITGEDDSSDDDSGSIAIDESDGEESGVNLVISDIAGVEADFVPESLEIDDSSNLINPCAGYDSPIACTPVLVKLYISLAKFMVGAMREVVGEVSDEINKFNEETGEKEFSDGEEGIEGIKYKIKPGGKAYSLIMEGPEGPFLFLAVNREDAAAKHYTMKFKLDMAPEEEDDEEGGGSGNVKMDLIVTEDGFVADLVLSHMECTDDDVRAPGSIAIKMTKDATAHYGQVLTYHPLWRVDDNASCSDTASADTEMAMMTEFVGNDDGVTGGVYYADRTLTNVANIDDYSLSNLCNKFDSFCSGGKAFGGSEPVSTYQNPACITADDITWGSECSDFPESNLKDKSTFPLPKEHQDIDLGFPTGPDLIQ